MTILSWIATLRAYFSHSAVTNRVVDNFTNYGSRIDYLIPTDNVLALLSLSNLMKIYSYFAGFRYDLMTTP